jgi:hypothetical protein
MCDLCRGMLDLAHGSGIESLQLARHWTCTTRRLQMSISKPREKLSREEIEDIIASNASLFKDDTNFPQYIAHLTLNLVECLYDPSAVKPQDSGSNSAFFSRARVIKSVRDGAELDGEDRCTHCGGLTYGEKRCPECGQFIM